jgi:hypothetical protein
VPAAREKLYDANSPDTDCDWHHSGDVRENGRSRIWGCSSAQSQRSSSFRWQETANVLGLFGDRLGRF